MSDPYKQETLQETMKKLQEARLQERAPQACSQCSRAHRKCEFKNRLDRCDKCASRNLPCSLSSRTSGSDAARHSDSADHGSAAAQSASTLPHTETAHYSGSYVDTSGSTDPQESTQRHSSGSYSSGSPTRSPVEAQSPSGYTPAPFQVQQGNPYQYVPGSPVSYTSAPSYYTTNTGPTYGHAAGSLHAVQQTSRYSPAQGNGPGAHFGPAQPHSQSLSPGFVSDTAQWAGLGSGRTPQVQAQPQSTQPTTCPAYQPVIYAGSTHSAPALRQSSAQAVPHVHTGAGQPHVRPTQAFHTQSPTCQAGAYMLTGTGMYQTPHGGQSQHVPARYATQGYNQHQAPPAPGSASGEMYYQHNMHQ